MEQANFRAFIIETCAESISVTTSNPNSWSSRCVISGPYFIKWGDRRLHYHAETQKYVYDQAAQDSNAPRVPRVYDCFSQNGYTYLVMECMQRSSLQDASLLHQKTAHAIEWLRCLPLPPDAKIGSLGGGLARHRLFQDWEAPLPFSNNEALEIYLNKSLTHIPPRWQPLPIQIKDEPLIFTQSNMDESNFTLDLTGKLCLLDFQAVGLLPQSFAVYTVKYPGKPFMQSVARYLPSWTSPNLDSMKRAGGILIMCADPTLGLNEKGNRSSTLRPAL